MLGYVGNENERGREGIDGWGWKFLYLKILQKILSGGMGGWGG